MKFDDVPFYVGYRPRADAATRRFVLAVVGIGGALAIGGLALLAALHPRADAGVFEWGATRTFEGVVRATPVPRLELEVPGAPGLRELLLVAAFKHGAQELVAPLDGRRVRAQGTLIHRGETAMLELGDAACEDLGPAAPAQAAQPLGDIVVRGEIVDSKCYLGVMKPGHLKPHRDCAVRCISGGVPPLLMVRGADGMATYFVLIGTHGEAINRAVLDFVAEPIEVSGSLERAGTLSYLRIDPARIRRTATTEEDVR
jgi:hypothetical protein